MLTPYASKLRAALTDKVEALNQLDRELSALDLTKLAGPQARPVAGSIFVGTLDESLKRLLALYRQAVKRYRKAARTIRDQNYVGNPGPHVVFAEECRARLAMLHDLLNESVIGYFPELAELAPSYPTYNLAYCAGWKVYLQPPARDEAGLVLLFVRRPERQANNHANGASDKPRTHSNGSGTNGRAGVNGNNGHHQRRRYPVGNRG